MLPSYLSDCSFCVPASNYKSSLSHLHFGVPQGSVLGPVLILVYMLPRQHILSTFKDLSYHCYTGNIQFYIFFKPHDVRNCTSYTV